MTSSVVDVEQIPCEVQPSDFDWFNLNHDGVRVGKVRTLIVADRVRFAARGFWQKLGFIDRGDGNWEFRRDGTR